MPLKPNFIERMLINVGIIPTVLLDTGVSLFQASALLTAGDIRLFNHLKSGPLTLEEISHKTDCSQRGVETLLNSLIPIGYVNKKGNQYSLTKAMLRSFPIDLFPDMVLFFRSLNENLNNATHAVKTDPDGGLVGYEMMKDGKVATSFQVAMRWLGSATVKEVVSRMKLPMIGWNLFVFAGGRAYDFEVVKQWLEEAGFHSVTLIHLRESPGFSFIKAQKR